VSKRSLIALLIIATSLGYIPAASAHTVLISSDPGVNSTITELPEKITLTFADPLLTINKKEINKVTVKDPMGVEITSEKNMVNGSHLSNFLNPAMVMSGKYQVHFRVVAQDGHLVEGSFSFTVGNSIISTISKPVPTGIFHVKALATGSGISAHNVSAQLRAMLNLDLIFSKKEICYTIGTNIKDVLAIHVHSENQTNMTVSDEIFLPLRIASFNAKKAICDIEPISTLTTLYYNLNHYMIVIHTKAFPEGAVAGKLQLVRN